MSVSGVVIALVCTRHTRHTLMARQEANTIGYMHCGNLVHSLQYLVSRFLSTLPFFLEKKNVWFAILF